MESNRSGKVKRIAITGPESTGKSWLAGELARHYHTVWVPEYAREYLHFKGPEYNLEDILHIAQGQLISENTMLKKANKYLFCDTEFIVTKIWAEHAFHHCPAWIINILENQRYDYYLLCNIDLPWEADPLREHPDLRQYFFDLFINELTVRDLPYTVVSGFGDARLQCAINSLKERFHNLRDK